MSTEPQNVPPAGEEIHLPPGSLQPHAVAAGLTVGLVTLTAWPIVSIASFLFMFGAIGLWIRDARREHRSLPAHHAHDDHADHSDHDVADADAAADAAPAEH